MRKLFQFFWPNFTKDNQLEADDKLKFAELKAKIESSIWVKHIDVALEQARAITNLETERSRSAETKATVYLTSVAAALPLLTYFFGNLREADFTNTPLSLKIAISTIFLFNLLYLIATAYRAFQVLEVAAYHRLDVEELSGDWRRRDFKKNVVNQLFIYILC